MANNILALDLGTTRYNNTLTFKPSNPIASQAFGVAVIAPNQEEERQQKLQPTSIEKQEAEQNQIEAQAKIELLCTIIDSTIQHIKDLQNYKLTYGELAKILVAMDEYYVGQRRKKEMTAWCDKIAKGKGCWKNYAHVLGCMIEMVLNHPSYTVLDGLTPLIILILKRDVKEKMKVYESLSGLPYPRWDEINKM